MLDSAIQTFSGIANETELPAIFDGILVSEPCGSKKASPFRVMET